MDSRNSLEIFCECHRRQCDGRGEADRSGNEAGHESDRRMINGRKKMIFATGPRQGGAQFSVTKRATERDDAADQPQQEKWESRMNFRKLKSEAGENAGTDDVGDDNGGGSRETDTTRQWRGFGLRIGRSSVNNDWHDS